MNEQKLDVSIVCLTYNQEKYIGKAIESFLMQKGDFSYEIIVHDDCSQDSTARIVKEYAQKYPDRIKTVLQKENQYSKNVNILEDIVVPMARGKYIALCEGDDYWIDQYKLKIQLDAFKNNPQCCICTHKVKIINSNGKYVGEIAPGKKNTIFSVEKVINGGGGFVGTNSILIKKKIFEDKYGVLATYSLDYTLQIAGSLSGGMIYVNRGMSVYRQNTEGSWTNRMIENPELYIDNCKNIIRALKCLNNDTHARYESVIKRNISLEEFEIMRVQNNYKSLFIKECDIWRNLYFIDKIKIIIKITYYKLFK